MSSERYHNRTKLLIVGGELCNEENTLRHNVFILSAESAVHLVILRGLGYL